MISIEVSRTGHPVLKKNERYLASSIDPIREASAWAEKAVANLGGQESIIVLGLGSGYHVHCLTKVAPSTTVIVLENDAEVIHQVASFLPQLRSSEIICVSDWTKLVENQLLCDAIGGLYRIAHHAPSCQLEKDYFKAVSALLLGRDKLSFLHLVKTRPEFLSILNPAALTEIPDENISIKTLQKLFAPTAVNSRERRVWRMLEELVA